MAVSFNDIANKKLEETVRAPLPPVGDYKWIVSKHPTVREGEQWDVVEFPLRALEAVNVDAEALEAYGDVSKVMNRKAFLFDKNDAVAFQNTENQLKRFLEDHLKCSDGTMSYKESFAASVNCTCIGELTWKADKNDPEVFHANIGKTTAVE